MTADIFNSSTWEPETGRWRVQGQPDLCGETLSRKRERGRTKRKIGAGSVAQWEGVSLICRRS